MVSPSLKFLLILLMFVYFGIEISYPENFERKDLNLIYTILDSEGNIILKQEILRAIQNQAVLFDYLILPSTTKKGTYTLQIEINDNKSNINTKSSTTFLVLDKPLSEIKKYFFILFIAILFVAILVIIDILKG